MCRSRLNGLSILILASWHWQVDLVVSRPSISVRSVAETVSDAESLKSFEASLRKQTTQALPTLTAHVLLLAELKTQRQSSVVSFASWPKSKVRMRFWSHLTRFIASTVTSGRRVRSSRVVSRMNYLGRSSTWATRHVSLLTPSTNAETGTSCLMRSQKLQNITKVT